MTALVRSKLRSDDKNGLHRLYFLLTNDSQALYRYERAINGAGFAPCYLPGASRKRSKNGAYYSVWKLPGVNPVCNRLIWETYEAMSKAASDPGGQFRQPHHDHRQEIIKRLQLHDAGQKRKKPGRKLPARS